MSTSQDNCYISLLGMAEYFRTTNQFKKSIQSLQALLTFKPPLKMEARTHLQLGQILQQYTNNMDLARHHLETAWMLSENINSFDEVKFETASVLAAFYQQQEQTSLAKPLLRKAVELSQHSVYWHSKLLFQIAQIHAADKEFTLASELLALGVESAEENNASYLKTLFLLSRAMILIIDRKSNDVLALLNQAGAIIENSIQNVHLREYLRVFFLILQVCHFLQLGHLKSVKGILKQLQQSIQTIIATNWPSDDQIFGQNSTEAFMWLPKEQMYVLVYLVTVSHSMMAGYIEKANKYTEKALTQIEKLKSQENKPILALFQIILLEHIIMCRLVMGNRSLAIKEIALAKDVCLSSPKKFLLKGHSAQLHCLLGLYAMSSNFFENAEAQFTVCIAETAQKELKLFANLNLAIVYLFQHTKEEKLKVLLEHIAAEYSQYFSNQAMLGSFYYVQGLNAFHKNLFHEAKRFLRESLKMANAEDLNRLTSCSLVLLSHVFLSINNSKESMNMVTPAMQLASKIPDIHVQLWGSAILRDLQKMLGNKQAEGEALEHHINFSQNLLNDQYKCSTLPEHSLLNWIDSSDPPPPIFEGNQPAPDYAIASTSGTF